MPGAPAPCEYAWALHPLLLLLILHASCLILGYTQDVPNMQTKALRIGMGPLAIGSAGRLASSAPNQCLAETPARVARTIAPSLSPASVSTARRISR